MKVFGLALVASMLVGCAHRADVPSTSAAYEVMGDRKQAGPAYLIISDDLAKLDRVVKSGFICSAHSYPVSIGPAIRTSIVRTMEGAYADATVFNTAGEPPRDGPVFSFKLDDFSPRLRFLPGFFIGSADATVDLSMRVQATSKEGKVLATTTVRGSGQANEDGGCDAGSGVLEIASQKALRVALENFVSRVINIDWTRAAAQ